MLSIEQVLKIVEAYAIDGELLLFALRACLQAHQRRCQKDKKILFHVLQVIIMVQR
jgi:hypothetical protein